MKIAVVATGGFPPGGDGRIVPSWLALFERLATSHHIHVFALRQLPEPQTYALRGFTVHDLGRPSAPFGLARWAQEKALTRALDQYGSFDLIHGLCAERAGRLAARAGRRLKIPSLVTCDGGEFVSLPKLKFGSQRTRRGRRAVHEACTLATSIHVCTKFMSALAHAKGVDTTIIPLTSVTSQAATHKSAFAKRAESTFRLIQVASLSRLKHQQLLIDALRIVREKIDAHLDLVGEDRLNGALQAYVTKIGLGEHVAFHGYLPQDRVVSLLSEADLYVQSSLHEAAGVSVLEAAACGVATVGTLTGYVADWSRTKAVAVGDAIPESMADAILMLHADPDRRRSIAAAARTFAIAHDATFAATRFDQLYRTLAKTSLPTRN